MKVSIVADQNYESECHKVLLSAVRSSFGEHLPSLIEKIKQLEQFSSQGRPRKVALVNQKVVGFIDWVDDEIKWLMVHKDYQNIGVGALLLRGAEAEMLRPVHVLCVKDNEGALRFYKRNGYTVIKDSVQGAMFSIGFENYLLQKA